LKRKSFHLSLPQDIRLYFNEELFFYKLPAGDYKEAIQYMCDELIKRGYVSADFYEKTIFREELSSTALAHLVAIPHPVEATANKTIIAITILEKPVKWGTSQAQLIFLMAIRKDDTRYLNNFFDITVRFVDHASIVHRLMKADNYEEFMTLLLQ
ncbi:MAG TPA: PTS sugar transporter subunit IIA, partial [Syntrophomonas sp.]|nr:PTS sugar transporter subunit IIA [Syntrophomonas sp.]